MAQQTKIEWTDVSWNPVHGCSKVSAGCNLFHEQIPDEYIWRVFATMVAAERHTFQVLTKRPARMRDMLLTESFWLEVRLRATDLVPTAPLPSPFHPPENVWLGVSIENRKWVGRADILRETPAAVRFISAEPLLGPLELDLTGIDWLIVGGESGSGHRPFDPQWARDLRDACMAQCRDCAALGTPDSAWTPGFQDDVTHWTPCTRTTAYFLKQMGGSRPGTALEDLPEDLRIREFPACR